MGCAENNGYKANVKGILSYKEIIFMGKCRQVTVLPVLSP